MGKKKIDEDDRLQGMDAIADFCGYSKTTVLKLYRASMLPIAKVNGGVWEGSKQEICEWWRSKFRPENIRADR